MLINYGINRKVGKKIEHKNAKINLPEVCDANWDDSCREGYIRKKIEAIIEPGWSVSGYAMHIYTTEEDYKVIKELLEYYKEIQYNSACNALDAVDRLAKRLRNFELAQKYKLEEPDDRNSQD